MPQGNTVKKLTGHRKTPGRSLTPEKNKFLLKCVVFYFGWLTIRHPLIYLAVQRFAICLVFHTCWFNCGTNENPQTQNYLPPYSVNRGQYVCVSFNTNIYRWIILLMRLIITARVMGGLLCMVCVCVCTSLTAHIRAMDPMLLVMVTSVALARSSLLMLSRFSLLIMWPKLWNKPYETAYKHTHAHKQSSYECYSVLINSGTEHENIIITFCQRVCFVSVDDLMEHHNNYSMMPVMRSVFHIVLWLNLWTKNCS